MGYTFLIRMARASNRLLPTDRRPIAAREALPSRFQWIALPSSGLVWSAGSDCLNAADTPNLSTAD